MVERGTHKPQKMVQFHSSAQNKNTPPGVFILCREVNNLYCLRMELNGGAL